MSTDSPLRVALIGTGSRAGYLYGPLLKALAGEVGLVSVWGRSAESARRLGKEIVLAIRQSASQGGGPVRLPLDTTAD